MQLFAGKFISLHVSGAFHTHHQEYIKLSTASVTVHIIVAATFFQRGQVQTLQRWKKVAATII